jgi:hypothetical protein
LIIGLNDRLKLSYIRAFSSEVNCAMFCCS